MVRTSFLFFFLSMGLASVAQTQIPASGFLDPQAAAQKANAHEEEVYSSATDALNSGQYDNAIKGFTEAAKIRGRRADGALYWKAYALNKAARKQEALATVAELRKEYPQSRYLKEAGALEIEIHSAAGQKVDPENQPDEDLKLYALDSIMQSDPERALPLLQKILQGNASARLKDKALFVLSQSDTDKAQQALLSVARGTTNPELQKKAIHWLGVNGNERNRQVLNELYLSSANPEVKKSVLHAFMVAGDKQRVFDLAQKETSLELKKDAIHQLGVLGAHAELRQLYKATTEKDAKEQILHSMGIGGDAQALIEVANTERDPEIRKQAIHSLGIFGGNEAVGVLTNMYNGQTDLETKKEVIHSLFIHGAAKSLIDLARKETNPELRQELVHRISLMHSPETTEFMMEILNK